MNRPDRNALIGISAVLLLGWGFAFVGSNGAIRAIEGFHPFAIGVALSFAIQWIAFIPAYALQTERYFDLIGSATYLIVVYTVAFTSDAIDPRSAVLLTLVSIWALRLGPFLFLRIRKAGKDGRFDALKPSIPRFMGAWTLQGLWVVFTLAAALAAISSDNRSELGFFAILGTAIWILGFAIEAIADWQKSRFTSTADNKGRFIDTGLWSRSRHPNYFGEIVLWTGIALIALPNLQGWQWLTLSSPLFVAFLLIKVSGIPLLEKRADEKWGGQADYEAYKQNVPVLFPKR
jgi:steroid 5-alpha reductase family enzyme